MRVILEELEGRGTLGEKYIQVLIAQELSQNSKWIIGGAGGMLPILDLRDITSGAQPTGTTP